MARLFYSFLSAFDYKDDVTGIGSSYHFDFSYMRNLASELKDFLH